MWWRNLAILAVFLVGCSHVRLDSWREKEFTLCGRGSADAYQEAALKVCADPTIVGGETRTEGFVATGQSSSVVGAPIRRKCQVYACPSGVHQ